MFVIYGPSGSGQDSVIEGLQKKMPLERVITTTTRPLRPTESQGHPYYFISQKEFEEKIENGELLEHLKKYDGVYYGVTKQEVERVAEDNKTGIWKIDFAGAEDIKKRFPELTVIRITAPLEVLEERIRKRDHPTEEYLQSRLHHIREWLPKSVYDFSVENEEGKLEQTVEQVYQIIKKHSEGK